MHIELLPYELLMDIGSYGNFYTLANLCAVNKRFNKIFTKQLYKKAAVLAAKGGRVHSNPAGYAIYSNNSWLLDQLLKHGLSPETKLYIDKPKEAVSLLALTIDIPCLWLEEDDGDEKPEYTADMMRVLLENGADPKAETKHRGMSVKNNDADSGVTTMLHKVASLRKFPPNNLMPQWVDLLLQYGADIDAENYGKTPLSYAAVNVRNKGREELVVLLLERGADITLKPIFYKYGLKELYTVKGCWKRDPVAEMLRYELCRRGIYAKMMAQW
jgi:hypothetical protein